MIDFIPSIFFTLFFVVDPLGLIPVLIVYLSAYQGRKRIWIIIKSILISIFVSIFFIFFGRYLLHFLNISSGSFLVAGGILLFIISMEMLLGHPSRIKMRNIYDNESIHNRDDGDVSVFPLAIPMLCGPGNIAALLMFSSQVNDDYSKLLILMIIMILVFLISMIIMIFSGRIGSFIGETGISILLRLNGLILSAMSVQFIRNGLVEMRIISKIGIN